MTDLRENESKTLLALKESGGHSTVDHIVQASGLTDSAVMRATLSLETLSLVMVHEKKRTKISLNEEGRRYAEGSLPERRLVEILKNMGGRASKESVLRNASLDRNISVIALGWLNRKGWAVIEKKTQELRLLKEPSEGSDEKLLLLFKEKESVVIDDLSDELKEAVEILKGRKIVEVHVETERQLELTAAGWGLVRKGLEVTTEVSQLAPELIVSGRWRETKLRAYDIKAPVAHSWPGKKHPYLRFLDDLKNILVAFGFKEMTGPNVELSFFNCDGLFMPQDHPAR